MYKRIRTVKAGLTPELVKEVCEMPAAPGERPLRASRLSFLEARLRDGHFYPPRWATAVVDGKKYRVNGQHSSKMLADSNGLFPHGMEVIIDEFSCDNHEDLAELFSQFDCRDSIRTGQEVVNAHARIHPELNHVSLTMINRLTCAISLAQSNTSEAPRRLTADERARLSHRYPDFILWTNALLQGPSFGRVPVMAAVFLTWQKNRQGAEQFWTWVRDENHTDADHPTRVLARFLTELRGAVWPEANKKWRPRIILIKCLHAWNAYRNGGKTGLKIFSDKLPKVL